MGKFRAALNRAELFEIRRKNRKFTWSNEQQTPTLVALDRVFCNTRWDALFPQHLLHAASTSVSDHCPLVLADACASPGRARFRFESFWPKFPGFHEAVSEAWMRPVQSSCKLLSLHVKLKRTANALRKWSKGLFSDAKLQFHMAQEIILRLDTAQENRTLSDAEWELRKKLKLRLSGLAAIERARKKQSSRINWLRAGDASTAFFHAKINSRRRKNFILSLKKGNCRVSDHKEKEKVILDHFQSIMGQKLTRACTINWDAINSP
ncbi:uncharacterized protein [Aegilops tauschii subsp. strangulata]|uniref:uncharacterized protein n=1 Tax=Aegilops tauschii subsp. strangulata TaxID=200361 RepID=UPI003CC8D47D